MRQTMKRLAILLPLAAALAACLGRSESSVGTAAEPLVVLFSPAHIPEGWVANPAIPLVTAAAGAPFDPKAVIEQKLSAASSLNIVLAAASTPLDAIERFGVRKADAGLLTVDEFLLAHQEYETAPGLQVLRGKGETSYDCVILVKAKSAARKPMDLDGGKFGYVDPYSVSGFLLPARFLDREGVKVEPVFLGSHGKALAALDKGEVAAIATYKGRLERRKDLRVLAVTGTAPNEPFVFRKGLLPEKRAALAKALRELTASAEGRRALRAVADITGFGPVEEGAYQAMHELLREAQKSVYDIVPDGAEVRRLNQPYIDAR
jgi:ABC-type phosphate/phosphonate transport system substrate-binding protein